MRSRRLRIVDFGLRIRRASARHNAGMANPQSAIRNLQFKVRIPHWLVGAAMLASLSTGCQGDHRTPLIVYSPHGRDLLTLLERRFEDLHPDVDVRWLDMGSQEVYDRLRSERANPQADVWFGGPATIFARGARDSLLESFRPTWVEALEPHGRGPGDLYFAAYDTPAVIVYAEQAVKPDEAPRDWDALLDPRWKGKILIRDPLASGTMRAVWGMIIERGLRQTHDTAAGFQWLRRLDAQTKEYVLNGPLLDQKIVRQEGLVTVWDLPDILLNRRDGLQLGYVFPRSGTPVIEDAIAVVRGSIFPLTRSPIGCATCGGGCGPPTSTGTSSPRAAPIGCGTGTSTCEGRGRAGGDGVPRPRGAHKAVGARCDRRADLARHRARRDRRPAGSVRER